MSGFFSKDEVLAFTINRGGGFVVLAVFGYLAAGLTAFYAFRLVFRVFYGEPRARGARAGGGRDAHHDPENPMTGEKEDTDVGFPGPEHHVAERAAPMRTAMAPLALLAIVAGALSIPRPHRRDRPLPRADLRRLALRERGTSDSAEWIGLLVGTLVTTPASPAPYYVYLRRPGTATPGCASASRGCTASS